MRGRGGGAREKGLERRGKRLGGGGGGGGTGREGRAARARREGRQGRKWEARKKGTDGRMEGRWRWTEDWKKRTEDGREGGEIRCGGTERRVAMGGGRQESCFRQTFSRNFSRGRRTGAAPPAPKPSGSHPPPPVPPRRAQAPAMARPARRCGSRSDSEASLGGGGSGARGLRNFPLAPARSLASSLPRAPLLRLLRFPSCGSSIGLSLTPSALLPFPDSPPSPSLALPSFLAPSPSLPSSLPRPPLLPRSLALSPEPLAGGRAAGEAGVAEGRV